MIIYLKEGSGSMIKDGAIADTPLTPRRWRRAAACLGKGLCLLPLCWLAGLMLLWAAFLIPENAAYQNAKASLPTLQSEGLHYNFGNEYDYYKQDTKLDGYTDLLMINFAVNNVQGKTRTPLERAVSPAWVSVSGSAEAANGADEMLSFLTGSETDPYDHQYYRRYWTGFIVPLRVLFSFLTVDGLRLFNGVLQALLVLAACFACFKKINWQCALALLVAYAALQPITLSKSLSCSPVFYVAYGGCLRVACLAGKRPLEKPPLLTFMLIGVLTAYFDYLSYPIAALGLPLTVYFAAMGKGLGAESLKRSLGCLAALCAAWFFGYLGMWGGKWIVGYLAGYADIFTEAMAATAERTSRSQYSVILTLIGLETYCFTKRKIALLLLPAALLFVYGVWKQTKERRWREAGRYALIFGLIALLPVAWTVFALNHTSLHWFYTHRIVCVFFAALTVGVDYSGLKARGEGRRGSMIV